MKQPCEDSDFYTLWGFVVGVVSLVVGVVAFWFAIVQIREARDSAKGAKDAAEAARDAAKKTLAESKESYERFVAAHAGRLLSERQDAVTRIEWRLAQMRCGDLADLIASLPAGLGDDAAIIEDVRQLREFGSEFGAFAEAERKRLPKPVEKDQWKPLLGRLHARLDRLRAPFREVNRAEDSPNNVPGSSAPPDSRADNEDQSGKSQLGS